MAYSIQLSHEDETTITFVGYRYGWSDTLERLGFDTEGTHEIAEHEAWELAEAFEADMDGGHSPFPMLDGHSDLYVKLTEFWQSIV